MGGIMHGNAAVIAKKNRLQIMHGSFHATLAPCHAVTTHRPAMNGMSFDSGLLALFIHIILFTALVVMAPQSSKNTCSQKVNFFRVNQYAQAIHNTCAHHTHLFKV